MLVYALTQINHGDVGIRNVACVFNFLRQPPESKQPGSLVAQLYCAVSARSIFVRLEGAETFVFEEDLLTTRRCGIPASMSSLKIVVKLGVRSDPGKTLMQIKTILRTLRKANWP
jgi:hypothetical protein